MLAGGSYPSSYDDGTGTKDAFWSAVSSLNNGQVDTMHVTDLSGHRPNDVLKTDKADIRNEGPHIHQD